MSVYTARRALRRPLTPWRRRRALRLGPINEAVWAAFDYSPAMRRFYFAVQENPSLLVDAELPDGAVVLDVGGYEGSWTQRLLEHADAHGVESLQVHAFEPEPGAVDRFHAAIGEDPRVRLHPSGLAGSDRTEAFAVAGPGSSVFIEGDAPSSLGATEVELRDVDAVLRSLEVERVDFAKLNIEGGEYELLDRLHATGWLPRFGPLIIQFHEFAPDAHRQRRRNRRQLAQTHRCTWEHPWVYERWDPR